MRVTVSRGGPSAYRDPDPPLAPTSLRYVARWRRTAAFAGLLLACSIFMPALKACDSVIVPSEEVRKDLPGARNLEDFATIVFLYLAPYLFGALAAIAALARDRHASWAGFASWTTATVAALTFAIGVVAAIDGGLAPVILLVIAVAAYFCSSLRLGRNAPMRATMVFAAACSLWFGLWSLGGYYGVRLSFVGATLLLAGSIGEGWGTLRRRLFW